MHKTLYSVIGAGAFAAALLAAPAQAVPVEGTSSGTFSNLDCGSLASKCDYSNGNKTIRWGSDRRTSIYNPSTLTINTVEIDTDTDDTGVLIAKLTWFNSSTDARYTPDDFSVTYNIEINFTQPNSTLTSGSFDFTIFNTNNPAGDLLLLPDLSTLAFDLDGVLVSNLRYVVGGDSSLKDNNTVWKTKEDKKGYLYIKADFEAYDEPPPPPTPAPEPATLALFGAGLLGLSRLRRRKQ